MTDKEKIPKKHSPTTTLQEYIAMIRKVSLGLSINTESSLPMNNSIDLSDAKWRTHLFPLRTKRVIAETAHSYNNKQTRMRTGYKVGPRRTIAFTLCFTVRQEQPYGYICIYTVSKHPPPLFFSLFFFINLLESIFFGYEISL